MGRNRKGPRVWTQLPEDVHAMFLSWCEHNHHDVSSGARAIICEAMESLHLQNIALTKAADAAELTGRAP